MNHQINKAQTIFPFVVIFMILVLLPGELSAQIAPVLEPIAIEVINVVKIIFSIAIIIGLIRTVIAFISGNPNAMRYLIYLIVAIIIFFSFVWVVDFLRTLGDPEDLING